jgi:hypothetical protein
LGLETKNNCAGEDRQQFTALLLIFKRLVRLTAEHEHVVEHRRVRRDAVELPFCLLSVAKETNVGF